MEREVTLNPTNVKVSYKQAWDAYGTHYTQMVSVKLTREQFQKFNNKVTEIKFSDYENTYFKLYTKHIEVGDNFANLSTCNAFFTFFGLMENKRIDVTRNTILRIHIIG